MRTKPYRQIEVDEVICKKLDNLKNDLGDRSSFTAFAEGILFKFCTGKLQGVSKIAFLPNIPNELQQIENETPNIQDHNEENKDKGSPWLSAKEAALYVGRKSRTAYKTMLFLARAGKIRAGHDGKTFIFQTKDLDAWMYLNAKKFVR